jgi:hypothetical protein
LYLRLPRGGFQPDNELSEGAQTTIELRPEKMIDYSLTY